MGLDPLGADLTPGRHLTLAAGAEPGADETVHLPYGIGRHRLEQPHEQKDVGTAELQVWVPPGCFCPPSRHSPARAVRQALAPLGGVERPRRVVRFARLIHAGGRAFWPGLRPAAFSGNQSLTWLP